MTLIERDDMLETFATRCSNQSLAERVRLWHADRCPEHVKTYGPRYIIPSPREDRIAVMNHEPIRFAAGQTASELLRRPRGGRRVLCDSPMHDASRADP